MQMLTTNNTKSDYSVDNEQEFITVIRNLSNDITQQDFNDLAKLFDFEVQNPVFLWPNNSNYYTIQQNPFDIYTLFGNTKSGKKSSIRWANRHKNYPIIKIDIQLFTTQLQFLDKLWSEVSSIVSMTKQKKQFLKNQQINLNELTKAIINNQLNLLIVIENAEILSESRRQIILYNLLEWMKKDVKTCVGLFFLCKNVHFLDNLEKRVKSRYVSKFLIYNSIDQKNLLKILQNRVNSHKNFKLIELITKFIHSYDFNIFIQRKLKKSCKMTQFLLILKQVFYSINYAKFIKYEQKNQYFYQLVIQADKQITPNIFIQLFRDLSCPQLILMSLIKNMIRQNFTIITFNQMMRYYAQIKRKIFANLPGSPYNYSNNILQKAFQRLIALHLIKIDSSDQLQVSSPITIEISIPDIQKLFSTMKVELSEYIRKILEYHN